MQVYKLDRLLTSAAAAADAAATDVAEVALVVDRLAPPGHRQKLRPPVRRKESLNRGEANFIQSLAPLRPSSSLHPAFDKIGKAFAQLTWPCLLLLRRRRRALQ